MNPPHFDMTTEHIVTEEETLLAITPLENRLPWQEPYPYLSKKDAEQAKIFTIGKMNFIITVLEGKLRYYTLSSEFVDGKKKETRRIWFLSTSPISPQEAIKKIEQDIAWKMQFPPKPDEINTKKFDQATRSNIWRKLQELKSAST